MDEGFILKFDFTDLTRQLDSLKREYSSIGDSFKAFATTVGSSVDAIQTKVSSLNLLLTSTMQSMDQFYSKLTGHLGTTVKHFNDLDKYSKSVAKNLGKINLADLSDASKVMAGAPVGGSRNPYMSFGMSLEASNSKEAEKALQAAQQAISAAKQALEEVKAAERGALESIKKVGEAIKAEFGKAGDSIKSKVSTFSQGMLGAGLVGSLLAMVMFGKEETQRKGAERGEMLNAVEAIGGTTKAGVNAAVDHLAKFAEKAQYYFGIGRKEIQGIATQLVNAGIKVDEKLINTKGNIDDVTDNVVSLTIGLDKMFNIQSGSSMNRALQLVKNYGISIESAVDKVAKLSFMAQRSGMEIQRFIDTVMAGSSALAQYGIESGNVAHTLMLIKKSYDDMGIDPKKSGEMAAQVTEGLVKGFANAPEALFVSFAQHTYPGMSPLAAKQRMMERQLHAPKEEQDLNILSFYKYVREEFAPKGETGAIEFFMKNMGFTYQQARYVVMELPKLESTSGGFVKATEAQMKEFMNTFVREGEQLTELQKSQRELLQGLGMIGEGILGMLSSLVGTLIFHIVQLPNMLKAAWLSFTGKDKEASALLDDYNKKAGKLYALFSSSADEVVEGGILAAKGGMDLFSAILPQLKDALKVTFDDSAKSTLQGVWNAFTDFESNYKFDKEVDITWKETMADALDSLTKRLNLPSISGSLRRSAEEDKSSIDAMSQMSDADRQAWIQSQRAYKNTTMPFSAGPTLGKDIISGVRGNLPTEVEAYINTKTIEKGLNQGSSVK